MAKDQFADLLSFTKQKDLSKLSLSERQSQSGTPSSSQWGDLNVLDRPSSAPSSGHIDLFEDLGMGPEEQMARGVQQVSASGQDHLFEGFSNGVMMESFGYGEKSPPAKKDDIDDLFAIFDAPMKQQQPSQQPPRPQHQHRRPQSQNQAQPQHKQSSTPQVSQDSQDQYDEAIATLVDMGFSLEQAVDGLTHTRTGLNVQGAVDYLMNKAHSKTSKPQKDDYMHMFSEYVSGATKILAEAQRKFMAPPPTEGRPAWMRDAERHRARSRAFDDEPLEITTNDLEKLKLERDRPQRAPPQPPRPRKSSLQQPKVELVHPSGPAPKANSTSQHEVNLFDEPIDLFSPVPTRAQPAEPEGKLFSSDSMPTSSKRRSARSTQTSTPRRTRPRLPISSTQLEFYKDSKVQGAICFKNGDFSGALQHYETSLSSLPEGHVFQIIALSNVITCLSKTGENKRLLELSTKALALIGDDKGAGEEIEGKSMKSFWIKIVTKRAETLEHVEKFKEALHEWTLLVENGAASKAVMDGKRRCQDIINPKPKVTKSSTPTPRAIPKPSPSASSSSASSNNEASQRIRETHKKEEQFEQDKYKLYDVVEQKLSSWKAGKEDNLRGLLSNLDTILWSEAQWKKVGMSDLVLPKKVKICYMKAVAKTHPDKVPASATSEQKMIAEGVFVVLNTAWESFKQQNGIS